MTFDYVAAQKLLLVLEPAVPVIKGWNRLEGRPRALDFERALRAEVRDALWFLTRQWQFGEFEGEDAASPVEVRTLVASAPFEHYAAKGGALSRYDATIPLEARVEGEPIARDLVTCVQVTRYFFMLIAGESNLAAMRALYLDAGAYALDTSAIEGVIDADATAMLALGTARTLDGAKLLAEIPTGAHDARVDAFPGLSADERSRLKEAAQKLGAWSQRLYRAPSDASDDAWAPRFLEYQFACVTKTSDGVGTTLAAESYDRGRLEWYAFDVDAPAITASPEPGPEAVPIPSPGPGVDPMPAPGPARAPPPALSFVPAPVSFGGMPSPRYWEFESRKTEFANIDANTTDVAKLLLTEFALVYANDWCVLPYVLDVGTLSEVPGLLVTDDFGETTLVRAAGRGADDGWQRWTLFTLSSRAPGGAADTRLLLAPTVTRALEGADSERVGFLRDEMANMVWAVEKTVPSAAGVPTDGYAAALAALPPIVPPTLHPTIAQARYILGTDVPPNWHPFIPVHVADSDRSVQLQRARMPGPARDILGRVLAVPSPYYINEEEVPRSGKIVTRAFQRARWIDGTTFTWCGRRASTGKGEGSSGLAFDQVQDIKSDGA